MAARQVASQTEKEPREIKLAHSPDSDDAFMFYALATHKLQTPGYKYTHILSDIQSLNEAALTETYDVTAVSFAAYPSLRDKYILLDCGASFGEGYGPIVVSTKSMRPQDLKGKRVGVPGLKTSAYLSLKLYQPDFEAVVMPFDKIIEAVKNEVVEAGMPRRVAISPAARPASSRAGGTRTTARSGAGRSSSTTRFAAKGRRPDSRTRTTGTPLAARCAVVDR